jgi:hypothetical protein
MRPRASHPGLADTWTVSQGGFGITLERIENLGGGMS